MQDEGDHHGRAGDRHVRWVLAAVVAVASSIVALSLVLGSGAGAQGVELSVTGSGPGPVTVDGTGDSNPVWLYQCADSPENGDMFWDVCDDASGQQVLDDTPWSVKYPAQAVVRTGDAFPPGTENAIGNGTTDCQAADAHCMIAATNDWQSFAWAEIPFPKLYGPIAKAVVSGTITGLTDGQAVGVGSDGHRPGTQAMTYICPRTEYAFPGACDPVPSSQATVSPTGRYERQVDMPRFVWIDDPFGHGEWYDCADGCGVLVASADNLVSAPWQDGVDQMLDFRAEPLVQHPQTLSVAHVRVNRMGGIAVDGLVDCTRAVAAWGQSGWPASVRISWTARQPLGRKGAVTAVYDAAVPTPCHDPADANPLTPPYRWATTSPVTGAGQWWVYPTAGGKFAAGPIHVEVRAAGGTASTSPGAGRYILSGASQWDGKAVRG